MRLVRLWRTDPLRWTLAAIAAGTAVSGLAQMIAPGFVLDLLSGPQTTATKIFFGIIGMFMFIIGGALTHALLEPYDRRVTVFWAALQKLGAAGAVSLAVVNDVFSRYALLLVAFDFLTGVLGMAYLWRIRR
ncbi:MAG: patatin [Thermoleophilia bacterium]